MKIAISNIAWPIEDEGDVAHMMKELGISGVEIAPTKVWDKPLEATANEVGRYRRFWNDQGIEIVALQALLFGQSELTLFENEDARSRTLDYLNKITQLGARLGARVLVFGSPKNRRTGRLPPKRASEIAISFFREAGRTAAEEGIVVCIEPNPTDYECDFITTSAEGLDLVNKVDNPGIGLHLDAAALTLSGEDLESSLLRCSGSIRHFHISEPFLGPIGQGGVDHPLIASTLRRMGYENWTSIEMRHNSDLPTLQETRRALVYAIDLYGGTKG